MARRVVTVMTDDLDGSDAVETVKFGLDGIQYEIDVSGKNAQKLRDVLAPFKVAGRKIGRGGVVPGGRAYVVRNATSPASKDLNTKIRAWAADNGIKVSDRGRIRQEVIDAYNANDPTLVPEAYRISAPEPEPAPEPAKPAKKAATAAVPAQKTVNGAAKPATASKRTGAKATAGK